MRMDDSGELILRCSCATRCNDRSCNQDNLRFSGMIEVTEPLGPLCAEASVWTDRTHVFCVCDGIGGSARGEVASRQALRALNRFLHSGGSRLPLEELAAEAAEAAHSAVLETYRDMGLSGGCTLVLVALRGEAYTMLNIGDSPAFLYSAATRMLTELSQRHSRGWLAAAQGEVCPEGKEGQLAYYLGKEGYMARDMMKITSGTLADGDGLLLCSDGVSNGLSENRLSKYLRQRNNAADLVEKASSVPGADNCTAICLYGKRVK